MTEMMGKAPRLRQQNVTALKKIGEAASSATNALLANMITPLEKGTNVVANISALPSIGLYRVANWMNRFRASAHGALVGAPVLSPRNRTAARPLPACYMRVPPQRVAPPVTPAPAPVQPAPAAAASAQTAGAASAPVATAA